MEFYKEKLLKDLEGQIFINHFHYTKAAPVFWVLHISIFKSVWDILLWVYAPIL